MTDAKRRFSKIEVYFFSDGELEVKLSGLEFISYGKLRDVNWLIERQFIKVSEESRSKARAEELKAQHLIDAVKESTSA